MVSRILVVDDEPKILQAIREHLTHEGFHTTTMEDPLKVPELALSGEYDLLVLDIMMPNRSGFEICRLVRQSSNVPIILLTARSDEFDKLLGLELGADDYITKPFSLRELTARIRTVLRRVDKQPEAEGDLLKSSTLVIDLTKFEAWMNKTPLSLTPTELKILHLLVAHPGQVFSRLQILEHVFTDAYEGYERTIDTHISNLRKKIDLDPSLPSAIQSVYGVGYKYS